MVDRPVGHDDADDYGVRAEECVRLANLTKDNMIQSELLSLRQTYLRRAEKLREIAGEAGQGEVPPDIGPARRVER